MTTVTIPQVTLPVGSRDFGPAAAADTESVITITIDRSVAGGLNSLTTATQIVLTSFQSNDGGTTWNELASATVVGGLIVKNGVTATQSGVSVHLWPGTSRQIKANLTVSGTSVAVQGTVTTQ